RPGSTPVVEGVGRTGWGEGLGLMVHVLLIEDDELVQDMLRTALELAGYDVTVAGNGRDGLHRFAERKPDIVVTGAGYFDLLIGAGGSSIGAVDFLHAAKSFGASHILNKPFSPKDLIAALKDCLIAS
ncbi:MAG: hypothetical protein J0626_09860, partial [Rhodospirillaceae bacterium]|nr:hypothetical protein [Rhodospirillaceae bacterium]